MLGISFLKYEIKRFTCHEILENHRKFAEKLIPFILLICSVPSVISKEMLEMLLLNCGMDSAADNDVDTLMAKVLFVQNHEDEMRLSYG